MERSADVGRLTAVIDDGHERRTTTNPLRRFISPYGTVLGSRAMRRSIDTYRIRVGPDSLWRCGGEFLSPAVGVAGAWRCEERSTVLVDRLIEPVYQYL